MSGPGFTVYQKTATRQAQGLQFIRTLQHVRPRVYSLSEHYNTSGSGFTVYQKAATRQAQGLQCIRTLQHVMPRVYSVSEHCNTSGPGFTVYQNTTTRHAEGLQCIRTLYYKKLEIYNYSPHYAYLISSRASLYLITLQPFKHRVYSSSEQNTKSGPWLQCTIPAPQSFRPKFTV
jgi:hypothetical protein